MKNVATILWSGVIVLAIIACFVLSACTRPDKPPTPELANAESWGAQCIRNNINSPNAFTQCKSACEERHYWTNSPYAIDAFGGTP